MKFDQVLSLQGSDKKAEALPALSEEAPTPQSEHQSAPLLPCPACFLISPGQDSHGWPPSKQRWNK